MLNCMYGIMLIVQYSYSETCSTADITFSYNTRSLGFIQDHHKTI